MKKILIIFIMAYLSACTIQKDYSMDFLEISTENQVFQVEVAADSFSRQKGLMFRETLEKEKGMLFVFEEEDVYSFWMKNTLIPLDIIWISADKKIVDIQTMQPCVTEDCKNYFPREIAKYVLEVGAGVFVGKIGDRVIFDY